MIVQFHDLAFCIFFVLCKFDKIGRQSDNAFGAIFYLLLDGIQIGCRFVQKIDTASFTKLGQRSALVISWYLEWAGTANGEDRMFTEMRLHSSNL